MARRLALLVVLLVTLSGCSSSDGTSSIPEDPQTQRGDGETMRWMLARTTSSLDPLFPQSFSDELVAAQIYEPLIDEVRGPQGLGQGSQPGLATAQPSRGGRVWDIQLRGGVRFQDGEPLDADAVAANFERWLQLRPGRRLLPEVTRIRVLESGLLRVRLAAPEPQLGEILGDPRLGLISPAAFDASSSEGARVEYPPLAGSGPFRLGERFDEDILLVSNLQWWGSEFDLGPALQRIELTPLPDASERYEALAAGEVHVADGLSAGRSEELRSLPLLTSRELDDGTVLWVERSVRGLGAAEFPPRLSRVWLTELGPPQD